MSYSNDPYKQEDEDLYDILSLSPPSLSKPNQLDSQVSSGLLGPDSDRQFSASYSIPSSYDLIYSNTESVPKAASPFQFHPSANVNLTKSATTNARNNSGFSTSNNLSHTSLSVNTNLNHNSNSSNNTATPSPSTDLLSPTNFSNYNGNPNQLSPGGGNSFHAHSNSNSNSISGGSYHNSSNSGGSFHTSSNHDHSSQLLHPRSPGAFSSHSLYSDAASNPTSPYLDAASQFSGHHNPPSHQQQLSDYGGDSQNLTNLQYLDTDPSNVLNTFDTEIALGGSISSTNLVSLDHDQDQIQPPPSFSLPQRNPPPQFNYSVNNQPMSLDFNTHNLVITPPPTSQTSLKHQDSSNRLTENNLISYNNSIQQQQPVISIQKAPQDVAAKTPSLFSNSSANSSIHNSPKALSRQNTGNNNQAPKFNGMNSLIPNSHLVYPNGSPHGSSNDLAGIKTEKDSLKVDEYQSIRRGRRKSHSNKSSVSGRSRSGSTNNLRVKQEDDDDDMDDEGEDNYEYDDGDEYDDEGEEGVPAKGVSSREKMLELASPSQPAKRTQKHPSVYACHLCEKRFTRPYNLKSHLRTHTDERPFICSVCGKAFARQHDRKRHEELHTGEKKFQCKGFLKDGSPYGCGRKFARADALRRHFQTENGKACIRLLIEEEELERQRNGGTGPPVTAASVTLIGENGEEILGTSNDYLSPTSALLGSHGSSSSHSIPQVAISPPD